MAVRRSSWTAVGVRVGGGAEYVCNCLSPPVSEVWKGMQDCTGASHSEAIEASVTAATQIHGTQQIPGPALAGRGARGRAWERQETHRPFLPTPLTSTRGTGVMLGVCLERAEAGLNGLTEACIHTHTPTGMLWSCLSCLRARGGDGGGTKWG